MGAAILCLGSVTGSQTTGGGRFLLFGFVGLRRPPANPERPALPCNSAPSPATVNVSSCGAERKADAPGKC